jgi:hypothetical protein
MLRCHVTGTLQRTYDFFVNNLPRKLSLAIDHWLLIFVPLHILSNQAVLSPSLLVRSASDHMAALIKSLSMSPWLSLTALMKAASV